MSLKPLTRHSLAAPVSLLLLTLLAYANSFPGAFILDDLHIAKNNALVIELDIVKIFTTDYWYGLENSGLYRPLTILSLALNRLLFGEGILGFHLVNVLLHGTAAILLWRLLLPVLAALPALLGAAVFAVHPIHTEVVNEVVGRSELQVAVFLLLAFLCARRDGWRATLLTAGCFALALLSKEHAITFVVLLPLWDWFTGHSPQALRRCWVRYAVLLSVALAWIVWREYGLVNPLPRFALTEAAAPLAHVPTLTRVLTALQLQWLYLGKMLLPTKLQAVYSVADLPPFISSFWSLRGLLVAGGWLLVLALVATGWKRRQPLALFAALYLVAFAPTANLFLPIGVTMAERLAYFPSVWYAAASGAAFALLLSHGRLQRPGYGLLAGYLLLLTGTTVWRNPDFASEVRLWSAEVAQNPGDFLGWQSLAESYANIGQPEQADIAYRRMMELAPDYPGGLRSRTYFLLRAELFAEALQTASRVYAISEAKGDVVAAAFDGLDMAEVHLGLGEPEKALGYLQRASVMPLKDHMRFLELRGKALAAVGRDAEAVADMARIDIEVPGSDLRYYHGLSLFRLGRLHEARERLQVAASVRGKEEDWNLLGVVCAQLGDWPAALVAFARAVELDPSSKHYQENLARARREATRVPR